VDSHDLMSRAPEISVSIYHLSWRDKCILAHVDGRKEYADSEPYLNVKSIQQASRIDGS